MTDNNVVEKRSPLVEMSKRLSMEASTLNDVLKKTAFRDCKTQEEFIAAVVVSNMYQLNPLRNEIYAFPSKRGGVQPIVSVDGWAKVISTHPSFDGMTFKELRSPDGKLEAYECSIYRKGFSRPITVVEYYDEVKRNTDPWNTMPRRMNRHASMKQCARIALGVTGIYDEDDMDRIKSSSPEDSSPLVSLRVKGEDKVAEPENKTIGNEEASQIYKQASKQGLKEKDIKKLIKKQYKIDSLSDLPVDSLAEFLNLLSDMSLKLDSELEM